jgi:hypothetical protein
MTDLAQDLPAASLRAAILKALLAAVDAASRDGKASLKDVMDALDIDSLTARLPDKAKVATIRRAGGKTTAKVRDEAKFLAWVHENRPGEVVHAVRDSYQKTLLEAMNDAGELVDPETGEVVPGVDWATGAAYLTVNFEPGGEDAIRQAWQSGRLSLDSLLALPAPEATDAV